MIYLLYIIDPMTALDGVNFDTRGIREQISVAKKIALRLVSPTIFEVEGWKRIQAIPLAFESFGFDPETVTVKFEEVELPISIGNKHFIGGKTYNKTFLVSFNKEKFSCFKIPSHYYDSLLMRRVEMGSKILGCIKQYRKIPQGGILPIYNCL